MPKVELPRALVLSTKRYNDTSFVINLFSKEHGRYAGIFKGKNPPSVGTFAQGRWQSRLTEQLGHLYIESLDAFSVRFLDDKKRLAAISTLCYLIEKTLPERQSFPFLFDQMELFLSHLDNDDFIQNYAHFEMDLLTALGFGLDTSSCAGDCGGMDLRYISPKTGRAVCALCGTPYRDKLLPLPAFLYKDAPASPTDIADALSLTGYFLTTHLNIQLPQTRQRLF